MEKQGLRRGGQQIQLSNRWRKQVLGKCQSSASMTTYVNMDKILNLSLSREVWTFTLAIS